jgi:hypothetical protein
MLLAHGAHEGTRPEPGQLPHELPRVRSHLSSTSGRARQPDLHPSGDRVQVRPGDQPEAPRVVARIDPTRQPAEELVPNPQQTTARSAAALPVACATAEKKIAHRLTLRLPRARLPKASAAPPRDDGGQQSEGTTKRPNPIPTLRRVGGSVRRACVPVPKPRGHSHRSQHS